MMSSGRLRLKPIVMMQSAQDRARHHVIRFRPSVSVLTQRSWQRRGGLGDPRPQGHVGTASIIVCGPRVQQTSQVVFGQRDDEIQAFPPQRTDEPLAEGIRLRTLGWGFQHPKSQVAYAVVRQCREDRVSVVDKETIGVVRWNRFTQLLQRPVRGGMRCYTDVEETAGHVFHDNKYIE
jgi:hypothetical protein